MPIRTRVQVDTRLLDALNREVGGLSDTVSVAMQEIANTVGEDAIQLLQAEPGTAVHPFVWSKNKAANERGRRGYFARVASGEIQTSNGRYRRTGKLKKSWRYRVVKRGDSTEFVIENTAKRGTKYVYGGFGKSGYNQIPGHRRTGWIEADPIATQAQQDFVDELRQQIPRLMMNGIIKRQNR